MSIDSVFQGNRNKSGLVSQLIEDIRRYLGKAIEGFGVTLSPRHDTDATLENVLDTLKSVERPGLSGLPQDDRPLASAGSRRQLTDHPFRMALRLLSCIKSAGFTRLKYHTLIRDPQPTDETDHSSEWAAFGGALRRCSGPNPERGGIYRYMLSE